MSSITTTEVTTHKTSPLTNPPPPLTFPLLKTHPEQTLALKLIVDSLAQERQTVAYTIITHPLSLSLLTTCLATCHILCTPFTVNLHTALLIHAGALLTYLLAVRWMTGPFLWAAEDFRCNEFLEGPLGTDSVIAARYGKKFVGAVVVRGIPEGTGDGEKTKKRKPRVEKVEIRAWTTMLRYRRRGLGRDLIAEAVAFARKEYGGKVEIVFADDHVNSGRFVSRWFMGSLDARERVARRVLQEELAGERGRNQCIKI